MKKILFVLAVLLLAAPAMADVTFSIVQSDTEPCDVYITYSNTPGPNVRAFALDIWVDDGNILAIEDYNVGECIGDANCGYGIFMGTIVINESGVVTDDGTPVAEFVDLPVDTLPGLDSNGVTTEMGSLYEAGVVPGPVQTGTLYRVRVSKLPCELCITTNVSRAGIVLENGDSSEDSAPSFTTNLPLCEPLAGAGCCPGDTDDNGKIDLSDFYRIMNDLSYANYLRTFGVGEPNYLIYNGCVTTGFLWDNCLDIIDDEKIDLSDFYKVMNDLSYANYLRTLGVGEPNYLIYQSCVTTGMLWPCP